MYAARRAVSLLALCAIFIGLLATVVVPVNAAVQVPRYETNGQRMARGLSPLAPRNLLTPDRTKSARGASPSHAPGTCGAGLTAQCCDDVEASNTSVVAQLLGLLGIKLDVVTQVGLTCSAKSLLCAGVAVCCESVLLGGVVSIGCNLLAEVGL